ncbi:putative phage tail assembly chaperone [Halodesulfovibrio aestuarii]|uniref:putative phage tail assembly chaperone n=1 Tax=Halodesulfovibrio aestuarii TaxID=126333 RepID=UPI000414AD9D
MDKTISLTVNGTDLAFDVTLDAFNTYANEMQPTDKINPCHNFLMRTVKAECKDALRDLLTLPGVAIELAAAVINDYKPKVTITLGK